MQCRIPEHVRRRVGVSATEVVTFVRLERGPYHDGLQFANGAAVPLQILGPRVEAAMIPLNAGVERHLRGYVPA